MYLWPGRLLNMRRSSIALPSRGRVMAIGLIVGSAALGVWSSLNFQLMRTNAESMYPAISHGDLLVVKRILTNDFTEQSLREMVGSIIIVRQNGSYLVKRLAGVSGDIVVVNSSGGISVQTSRNGELPESTANVISRVYIPPDHIYVLGDNQENSVDSRTFGVIPAANITGRLLATLTKRNMLKCEPNTFCG